MTELAEKKIRTFCARRHLKCEWQDMKNLGERAVVKTQDRDLHAQILKAACRIKELRVDYNLLDLLMRREMDDEGKFQIRWGEQKIA